MQLLIIVTDTRVDSVLQLLNALSTIAQQCLRQFYCG
jgi:hypothetical protein